LLLLLLSATAPPTRRLGSRARADIPFRYDTLRLPLRLCTIMQPQHAAQQRAPTRPCGWGCTNAARSDAH
jgi:hypothetical protein